MSGGGGVLRATPEKAGSAMTVERQAFVMRLKSGALPRYREVHDAVWPEVVEALRAHGVLDVAIFVDADRLVVVSQIADPGAWERVWATDAHRRWSEHMSALLEVDDGVPASESLELVYALRPAEVAA